jgi:predicted  nucleic acid-binding Zn-ribbon protein
MEQDSIGEVTGGSLKQLKQRIIYLEAAVRDLEKERSELTVRATMAEQQLKTLQECFKKTTQDYERKLNDLKKKSIHQ